MHVVAASAHQTTLYLQAAENTRIAGAGYAIVLTGESIFYLQNIFDSDTEAILRTGPLVMVETGTGAARTHAEFMAYSIGESLKRLVDALWRLNTYDAGFFTISPQLVRDKMVELYYNIDLTLKPDFDLLNIVDGVAVPVGSSTNVAVVIKVTII